VLSQQVKELSAANSSSKKALTGLRDDITGLKSVVNQGKDQSTEVVGQRVSAVEQSLTKLTAEIKERDLKTEAATHQHGRHSEAFEREFRGELHGVQVELQEVRRLIADAPSFDVDGVLNTETLIRAIQRDSRRIDNFNETFVAVKDENEIMRACMAQITECIQDLCTELESFVGEHNTVKAVLIHQVDRCFINAESVRGEVRECRRNVTDLVDVTSNSINSISSTFLQVYQFLHRITTKAIPLFQSFDDQLLEFQRLSDKVQGEADDEAKSAEILDHVLIDQRNRTRGMSLVLTEETAEDLRSEFVIRAIDVAAPDFSSARRRSFARDATSGPRGLVRNQETVSVREVERDQGMADVRRRLDRLVGQFEQVRTEIEKKVENKADSANLDRIVETVKSISGRAREDVRRMEKRLEKRLGGFVDREDIEAMIKLVIEQRGGPLVAVRPAAGWTQASPPRRGTGGRAVIPALPAHAEIYGNAQGIVLGARKA